MGPGDTRDGAAGSVAEAVRGYIDTRPVIREALARDLVNLSELARRIASELDIEKMPAILAACRRHRETLEPSRNDEDVRQALGESRLEIRRRIASVSVRRTQAAEEALRRAASPCENGAPFHLVSENDALTIITRDALTREIAHALEQETVLDRRENLLEVAVRSSGQIATTPGILAHLSANLSQRGVNVVHAVSGRHAMTFIVEQGSMAATVEILDELVSDRAT